MPLCRGLSLVGNQMNAVVGIRDQETAKQVVARGDWLNEILAAQLSQRKTDLVLSNCRLEKHRFRR